MSNLFKHFNVDGNKAKDLGWCLSQEYECARMFHKFLVRFWPNNFGVVVHPICQKTQFGQIHSDSLHFVTTLGDFQQTVCFRPLDYHQDQEGTAGISWALSNVNDCTMGYHDMVSKLEFQ